MDFPYLPFILAFLLLIIEAFVTIVLGYTVWLIIRALRKYLREDIEK